MNQFRQSIRFHCVNMEQGSGRHRYSMSQNRKRESPHLPSFRQRIGHVIFYALDLNLHNP